MIVLINLALAILVVVAVFRLIRWIGEIWIVGAEIEDHDDSQ